MPPRQRPPLLGELGTGHTAAQRSQGWARGGHRNHSPAGPGLRGGGPAAWVHRRQEQGRRHRAARGREARPWRGG
ncbi:hypothetical protein PR202_gb29326 [Eleusine coracana subsp. coracana]|uniref:Uncharacterized protein n=1 Tax=Eleusine coracana subsp. coracana TaxID=191504 RepID=A0AAV5FZD7_ELECO|nr:hypothetical protein PR202_gb29326 [Eleusine coracana subsp. coracana]